VPPFAARTCTCITGGCRHHNDATGPHQPRGFRGEETDRTSAKHHDDIAFLDLAELRTKVTRGTRVRQQDGVFLFHPLRNLARTDVGEGHAHEFGLPAVVAAARV
jgi:hypothetical protein